MITEVTGPTASPRRHRVPGQVRRAELARLGRPHDGPRWPPARGGTQILAAPRGGACHVARNHNTRASLSCRVEENVGRRRRRARSTHVDFSRAMVWFYQAHHQLARSANRDTAARRSIRGCLTLRLPSADLSIQPLLRQDQPNGLQSSHTAMPATPATMVANPMAMLHGAVNHTGSLDDFSSPSPCTLFCAETELPPDN